MGDKLGIISSSYSPASAYLPNINKPTEATGVMMSIMIRPNIKSSCLPDMMLGNPNSRTPKNAVTNPSSIHTIPNPLLNLLNVDENAVITKGTFVLFKVKQPNNKAYAHHNNRIG